ncbi:TetR/AcrR family transcriptional regulator [Rhodococcus fascians]|nr:TetR/AcrR family transcriptional regulator [Rhodococcus fascians]
MTAPNKRTREDPRGRTTELAFLRATERLLDEGASYRDLNVSVVAERAGRTRTAFYARFKDRNDLLLSLLAESTTQALTVLHLFFTSDSEFSLGELTKSVRSLLAAFSEHSTLIRAVIEAAGYEEDIAEYWDNIIGQVIDVAKERLKLSGFGDADAAATATTLVWMTERMCYQHTVRGRLGLSDDAVVASISDVWFAVLRSRS